MNRFGKIVWYACLLQVLWLINVDTLRGNDENRTQAAQDDVRVRHQGVPQGLLVSETFEGSKRFPGTTRRFQVYIPDQYDGSSPANLMVFMDGSGYAREAGAFRVPIVFDNLIHRKQMPVTIAVFVDPGTIKAAREGAKDRSNRSFEYDSLGSRYADFLVEEFLPVALDGLKVSDDPSRRAVCGISSGGICAFTVAWEKPEQFGKVMSHIGSFTNIRGGWAYPGLVRKTKDSPKPIKVYLQEGRDDLSNLHGSWPLGNQDLAAALQFAGYHYKLEMTDGGHSGKWAGEIFPDAVRWLWDPDSEPTKLANEATKPTWEPHPDAIRREDVPQGKVIEMEPWESKIFPGTTRAWAIYVPAQYRAETPAALMVFQDGERMRKLNGRWRIPIVFDNLIAAGEMPPTIAVFVNPGHDMSRPRRNNRHSNRGYEYDSLGAKYVNFLLEELIPVVEKDYRISSDPRMRAIGGSSSGAICAFTAAWERPDQFRKVYSNVGSFTHLRGGNEYPALVRKTEPKPIRVYMSDTSGDVDNAFGSWPWANQRMSDALDYMGYDVRFDWAKGYAHNADFGSARFPDAMRWLWRDEVHVTDVDTSDDLGGDLTLLNLLLPEEEWEVVVDELGFADALCSDRAGNLFYCDMRKPAIYRMAANGGTPKVLASVAVSGLAFSPDEKTLYGCQGSEKQVIAIDVATGEVRTIAEDVTPNDIAVTSDGLIFITETRSRRVTKIDPKSGSVTVVDEGVALPNGIGLSNDGGTLAVSEYGGEFTWLYRVNLDGSLDAKMPNMKLRRKIDLAGEFRFNQKPPLVKTARGDGLAIDRIGRFYVTSELGVQIFDPTGRPCGLLPKPLADKPLTTCILAGPELQTLFIAQGSTILKRRLQVDKP